MKKLKILGLTLPLSFILFLGLTMSGFAETEISKAKLPVLQLLPVKAQMSQH